MITTELEPTSWESPAGVKLAPITPQPCHDGRCVPAIHWRRCIHGLRLRECAICNAVPQERAKQFSYDQFWRDERDKTCWLPPIYAPQAFPEGYVRVAMPEFPAVALREDDAAGDVSIEWLYNHAFAEVIQPFEKGRMRHTPWPRRQSLYRIFSGLTNNYHPLPIEIAKKRQTRKRLARGQTVPESQFDVVVHDCYACQGLSTCQTRDALRQVLVLGRKVTEVAQEVGIAAGNLKRRTTDLRAKIKSKFPAIHPQVQAAAGQPRDHKFQPWAFSRGDLKMRRQEI